MKYKRTYLISLILLPLTACVDFTGDDDPQESTLEENLFYGGGEGGGVQPTSPPRTRVETPPSSPRR